MCGIYAIISRTRMGLNLDDTDVLKQMMLDTVQRGDNSSGLFMTDYQQPKLSPTGVKVLGGPHNIIYNEPLWKEVGQFMQRHGGAVVGHGRYATRGKVSAENAHPFQHDHITLVHNGTIHGGVSYAKRGETSIDVDSHALTVAVAEKGIMEALSEVRGAYAVIAHDANEGCLYIARNNDRPLFVYSNNTRHYIMSEGPFLDTILSRYNKKEKDCHVMYFKPEILIKIDLANPDKYENVGDIAALRTQHEEEERAKREKEAEEHRKKFPLAANNGGYYGSQKGSATKSVDSSKEKATLERELKTTTFIVQSVEPYGVNFKYRCRNTAGQDVCFISDQNKPEYVDLIGHARIHSYVYKGTAQSLFVRHRDIKWIDTIDDTKDPVILTKEEEPTNVGTFLTHNNKRIPCDVWAKRIINEGCDTCAQTFKYLSYRDVVLTDDDMLLCVPCAKEFNVVPTTPKVH